MGTIVIKKYSTMLTNLTKNIIGENVINYISKGSL